MRRGRLKKQFFPGQLRPTGSPTEILYCGVLGPVVAGAGRAVGGAPVDVVDLALRAARRARSRWMSGWFGSPPVVIHPSV